MIKKKDSREATFNLSSAKTWCCMLKAVHFTRTYGYGLGDWQMKIESNKKLLSEIEFIFSLINYIWLLLKWRDTVLQRVGFVQKLWHVSMDYSKILRFEKFHFDSVIFSRILNKNYKFRYDIIRTGTHCTSLTISLYHASRNYNLSFKFYKLQFMFSLRNDDI